VVENKDEMHGSFTQAAEYLRSDKAFLEFFSKAFVDTLVVITPEKIQHALASYVRSQLSLNSRFDKYMRGDSVILTKEEISGFNIFMGKAQCGICHFMPLFNGTVPPAFVESESEVIGVPSAIKWEEAELDPDVGRFAIYEMEQLRFAFKTPTVRNVELTAPYMHNGVYPSLEDVVEFYNRGGGIGLGISLPNQTLPADSLNLNKQEKQQLAAFMRALSDVPMNDTARRND
jgi:cytochrome c peroxidase